MKKSEEVKDISELEEEIEESDLEEVVDEISDEEVDDSRFQQFMQMPAGQMTAPTLDQINQPFQTPNLEQDTASTISTSIPEEESPKAYSFTTEEEAKKYESSSGMRAPILTSDRNIPEQRFLLNPLEGRDIPRTDDMQPRMMRTQTKTERRKLPFEKDDEKYKEVKF